MATITISPVVLFLVIVFYSLLILFFLGNILVRCGCYKEGGLCDRMNRFFCGCCDDDELSNSEKADLAKAEYGDIARSLHDEMNPLNPDLVGGRPKLRI